MSLTGYGPRNAKIQRLLFDGDDTKYELWEARFLGYLQTLKLKATILPSEEEPDATKNEECYAELIQLLDDKSLSLVMRDAAGDGRKALKILREHYASQGKPRIIALYTELTSLEKGETETVTDYIIRAEKSITALKNAKEILSEGLVIAMILKGLPDAYKPFVVHVTQSTSEISFAMFKCQLKSFEETEKFHYKPKTDQVMKVQTPSNSLTCFGCGRQGHFIKDCPEKTKNETSKWCPYHKSTTHSDSTCRRHQHRDQEATKAKQATSWAKSFDAGDEHSFAFQVSTAQHSQYKDNGMLVDTGATSHIVTKDILKRVDGSFTPAKHYMELADGTRSNNVAVKRGDAEVMLRDMNGRPVKAVLKGALFIPSYPQDIFSVKAAISNGAEIKFSQDQSELVYKDGTKFIIEEHERLYYLNTIEQCIDKNSRNDEGNRSEDDQVNLACSIYKWHEILGHCNFDDIMKLKDEVNGMKIVGKIDRTRLECNTCTEGKYVDSRNRKPDSRATRPLEKVHTDLAGPINPVSKNGFKYCIAFTDDFSGAVFVYFLKKKTDTLLATEKFLADCAPYGQVKCLRSDNGTEFMNDDFQTLLRKKGIKHETSCPNSPHQNGTAERHWRTLFEMARCLLLENGVPKMLWPYAVQTAAHIRNRCYNNRTKSTPYFCMTGRKPDLSKMWIFGSECYTYEYDRKKLDPKGVKGVFVGYDKNSPAYLVYHPEAGKVMKHRLVKFIKSSSAEQGTQTEVDIDLSEKGENEIPLNDVVVEKKDEATTESDEVDDRLSGDDEVQLGESEVEVDNSIEVEDEARVYPQRERKAPEYFGAAYINVDYCYTANGTPQTYTEAINSPRALGWECAMRDELEALKVNDTFELTVLPEGKNLVGGKWVYTVKEDANGSETLKARYVAKGYSQVHGVDYEETFSPTANITSIRILMQLAAQYNLTVHQMDVKAAFLHAPIDHEIFMEQPEGFEEFSENGQRLVYRLKKSLYGLKQSGRNWNRVLDDYLISDGFVRNPVDHCVYRKQTGANVIIIVVWVDDLIIASNNTVMLCQFKENMKCKFRMKDLGEISHFLGMDFKQENGTIKMNQRRYILKILDRFEMSNCKPRTTPCEQRLESTERSEAADPRRFREIVGSLIYLMTCTRPDISWVVSKLSQKLSCPKMEDLATAKHVLRYLKGTMEYELCYRKCESGLSLIAYSDADWASSLEDRHSTTGYCFSLTESGPLISWKSKKQPTIALSTCEAEYVSLAASTQESLYLMQLLKGMDSKSYECTRIYEDNQGAIALSKNPVNRQRCKHIDIKYHFLRDVLASGKIDIVYCQTEHMVADILTKPATRSKLAKFKKVLFGL